jgi:hypothetical protein
MSERDKIAQRITQQLARVADLRASAKVDPKAADARRRFRAWQSERLARTHADLLASKRFGKAASFFLSDVYGANDPANRDEEVQRAVPTMIKLLTSGGLEIVADAIELDALSEDLDAEMIAAIGRRVTSLNAAAYGRAYRKVGRRADRQRQIDLIRSLGHSLDLLAHRSFVAMSLTMMRQPAKLAGLSDLHSFLERGYASFRAMPNADEFIDLVVTREQALLDSLFAGDDSLLG